MLTASVDAGEWLLVEQYTETVLACHTLHYRHQQHIVVNGEVSFLEDRSKLKLVWSHLVVTCLAWDAKFESLNLKLLHEGCHTLWNGTEVVVIHLLVLSRVMSHECASCEQKVRTCGIQSLVNEEVLLLPSEIRLHLLHFGIEIVAYLSSGYVDCLQRTQQRRLIVECLTAV